MIDMRLDIYLGRIVVNGAADKSGARSLGISRHPSVELKSEVDGRQDMPTRCRILEDYFYG